MRAQDDLGVVAVTDLTDDLQHPLAPVRIEPIRRLIQDQHSRSVDDGDCEFGHLFHAERIGTHISIAGLAQSELEQSFVSPFQRIRRRQARQFGHHTYQTYAGRSSNERIVFRHVADLVPDLADLRADIHSQDPGGPLCWRMKAQESLN